MPATIRKRFLVRGRVQRVGYRALVLAFADSLGIKGLVRNLPERTVEIVCEGQQIDIASLLNAIDRKGDPMDPLSINVSSIEEVPGPPEGEFTSFMIDYGRELTPIERESLDRDEIMILGAGILNIKVDGVGNKVDSMHGDMNARFDHMAGRYDDIADTLKVAVAHMERSTARTPLTQQDGP